MDDELVAPAPDEWAQLTVERAMWQSFGLRIDDMTALDYETKATMLAVESKYRKKGQQQ